VPSPHGSAALPEPGTRPDFRAQRAVHRRRPKGRLALVSQAHVRRGGGHSGERAPADQTTIPRPHGGRAPEVPFADRARRHGPGVRTDRASGRGRPLGARERPPRSLAIHRHVCLAGRPMAGCLGPDHALARRVGLVIRERTSAQRAPLLQSRLALVEDLRCQGGRATTSGEGYSAAFQVCLPYRGLFVWHVGDDQVVSDANQVLFVSGGETYRVTEPLPGGYAELIVTPARDLIAELAHTAAERLPLHPLFRRRSRRADPGLQVLRARFLHRASNGGDGLAADELVIALLRAALAADAPARVPGATTRRLIGRTKEFVEAHLSSPIRLGDVAQAV